MSISFEIGMHYWGDGDSTSFTVAGLDYLPTTQELLITPTNVAMPQCVPIPLLDDDTFEMNENFSVLISTTDDAVQLTTSSAVVVIENDGM